MQIIFLKNMATLVRFDALLCVFGHVLMLFSRISVCLADLAAVGDGTHVPILRPTMWENDYINYKCERALFGMTSSGFAAFHSVNLSAFVGFDWKFIWASSLFISV